MIDQATFKKEKRRLAIAQNRFERARRAVPPNPFAAETENELELALQAAAKLFDVAREGLDLFVDKGYPDSWAMWDAAEREAAAFIHRNLDSARILGLTV